MAFAWFNSDIKNRKESKNKNAVFNFCTIFNFGIIVSKLSMIMSVSYNHLVKKCLILEVKVPFTVVK
jgi:hypothetical protein